MPENVVAVPEVLNEYRIHQHNITGSSVLTTSSISRWVEAHLKCFRAQKDFLETNYGPEVASYLRIEDRSDYLEQLLKLYILEGRPKNGVYGYPVNYLMVHLPKTPRKRLLQLIMDLPDGLAKRVLRLWQSQSPRKKVIKKATWPVWRLLGLRW